MPRSALQHAGSHPAESEVAHTGSSDVTSRTAWAGYLRQFHAQRPGITEHAFTHAVHARVGSPYQWLAEPLPKEPGAVLDLACGNAAMLPWLSGHASYLGVDLSRGEIEHARSQGRGPVVFGDARRLPLPDSSIDTVVSSMGLMLVRPPEPAVAEIARVLRRGGTLALLVPSTWPIRARDVPLGVALTALLHGPGSMPQLLTTGRLRRLLSAAGLSVIDARRRRFPFAVHTQEHASLAVQSLYTPGRSDRQLARAEALLARRAGTGTELPVPLLRVVARRA